MTFSACPCWFAGEEVVGLTHWGSGVWWHQVGVTGGQRGSRIIMGVQKKSLGVIDEEVSVGMGSTWRRE